ncbi:hypothetical protein P3342_007468 [Pyrenophora teres f. teres]|nr:hypothetical protein P3342_007468 [Pyrenophora teres f. teres]
MIAAANPQAEAALWQSHRSVSVYVMRLYNHLLPRIVLALSEAASKIHVSFNSWTTKGGKKGYLGIIAHFVNRLSKLIDLPIALPQLMGPHSGENMVEIVYSYFVLDNAYNNDTTITALASKFGFNAAHRRLRCGPHTLNLIGQTLLWGVDGDAYDNNVVAERRSVGYTLAVINHIKTPQQYELFESFQRLAHKELSTADDDIKILQPIKLVVTRWNSYYSCFERAAKLQPAVNAYANYHISDTKLRVERAIEQGNKVPKKPTWMKSDGLTAHDWQVITEYIDILGPLKTATKRLEGHSQGSFGLVAEIIPVFEVLLHKLEQQLEKFDFVNHEEHAEAPEDYLAINLRAALIKAREYYSKLDETPAYYAAIILHPRYKLFCDTV